MQSPATASLVEDLVLLQQLLTSLSHLGEAGEQEVSGQGGAWCTGGKPRDMCSMCVCLNLGACTACHVPGLIRTCPMIAKSLCAGPGTGLVRRQLPGAAAPAGGGHEGAGEHVLAGCNCVWLQL